jgi:hypothetical protein
MYSYFATRNTLCRPANPKPQDLARNADDDQTQLGKKA